MNFSNFLTALTNFDMKHGKILRNGCRAYHELKISDNF